VVIFQGDKLFSLAHGKLNLDRGHIISLCIYHQCSIYLLSFVYMVLLYHQCIHVILACYFWLMHTHYLYNFCTSEGEFYLVSLLNKIWTMHWARHQGRLYGEWVWRELIQWIKREGERDKKDVGLGLRMDSLNFFLYVFKFSPSNLLSHFISL
jgi:hypothetical protein